jgi:hypothetical protein
MRQIAFTVNEVCSLGCGKAFNFLLGWGDTDGEETESEESGQEEKALVQAVP